MVGNVYVCKEDFEVHRDYYGTDLGPGTIRKGREYVLVRKPTPEKKMYKLKEIPVGNYKPSCLYLRKNKFDKYFKLKGAD